MTKLRDLLDTIRMAAQWYEPTMAKTIVAALFQMLLGVGVAVGDWPAKVDAVLAFVTVLTTLIAGRSIRNSVYSPSSHSADMTKARLNGYREGIADVAEGRS